MVEIARWGGGDGVGGEIKRVHYRCMVKEVIQDKVHVYFDGESGGVADHGEGFLARGVGQKDGEDERITVEVAV